MSTNNSELSNFDIDTLVNFINSNESLNNISLQFSPELQNEFQIQLYSLLKDKINSNKKLFIIGDTSYSSCCCDEVTAMHLNVDIIIRVGSSCFTRNSKIPIYFLYQNLTFSKEEIDVVREKIKEIKEKEGDNCIIFYNEQTKKNLIDKIRNEFSVQLADIDNDDIQNKKEGLLYGRNIKGFEITSFTNIIYIGKESDILITELSARYVNSIKSINIIDMHQLTIEKISTTSINPFLYRRFNLIEKAKQSQTFGILIGSLSLPNLNSVISEIKHTLQLKDKKHYTFLLGKITEEKLSNFIEYIDCFILVACPFNPGYSNKALMRPIVSPLDIKLAFDENYKWNSEYSLDTNYISKQARTTASKQNEEEDKANQLIKEMEEKCQSLQIKNVNEALIPIFSETTIINYDKRKFKGLEDKSNEEEAPKKVIKGKRGIPIKYENIE